MAEPILQRAPPVLTVQLGPKCCPAPKLELASWCTEQAFGETHEDLLELSLDCSTCGATCIDAARLGINWLEA